MMDATRPEFSELVRVFGRIGLINFGGPAGQIALMHRELVDDHRWVSEEDFLNALNFCHLFPGPEAQQLATYIGWKLHGLKGGLAAGLLFILPGALVVLGLTILYALASGLTWFTALFTGIKAAVLAIVVQALFRIAGRALDTPFKRVLAGIAFIGLFVLSLPFPLIVLGAGLIGALAVKVRPDWLKLKPARAATTPRPRLSGTLATVAGWGAVWAAPMLLVLATLGTGHELWRIGSFFSQLAVVTFGGAYAVLAYMAQEAVQGLGWLNAGEMADGLGLAETTPGPLILVTQFVGFLAAFRTPEPFSPMLAGLLGAGLTTWVTFAPCFLWIFAFAPWIEHLQASTRLRGGLAALTAAVVGVIANLSLWFALHVLFRRVGTVEWGAVKLSMPDLATLDWRAALLSALAFLLLFRLKWTVPKVLAACAIGGLLLGLA
jgi:chromate transporter